MTRTPYLSEVQITCLNRIQQELARGNAALELLRIGFRMRAAQRSYFADRSREKLVLSKTLEKEFDTGLDALAQRSAGAGTGSD